MQTDELKFRQDVQSAVHAYSIGRFRLDLQRGELLRDGQHIPLRPKSFDVLHCLVSHAGELISRETLLESVWPDLVVTDDSLTQCLIEIRKALGDDEKKIIVTVPRRGYRLEAGVQVHTGAGQSGTVPSEAVATNSRAPSKWTLAALAVLALAVAATWWRAGSGPADDLPATGDWNPPAASIAVLPFADMSEAGDQAFLGDGIAEEILNLLAQSRELVVIARTSSFSFREMSPDIETIARQLNVAYVLEGSVRKAGDSVRVTAQLVDGLTEAHLWSKTYDDKIHDIFAMQDRIAQEVAETLQIELTGDAGESAISHRHTPDPSAWEEYLHGRLFYSRRSAGDVLRAQGAFERAVEIDPDFAEAWVGLAATFNLRRAGDPVTDEEQLSPEAAYPLIRNALEKAIALDPDNAEALWRMAFFSWDEGNLDKAIEQFARAAESGRNNALVQAMMGGFAFEHGQHEMALPFTMRSLVLDPVNASTRYNLGAFLFASGRLDDAEAAFRQDLEIRLENESALAWLCWIKIHQQDLAAAEALSEKLSPGPDLYQAQAILSQLRGQQEAADEALGRLLALPSEEAANHLALVYGARGEIDEAFNWMWQATNRVLDSPDRKEIARHVFPLQVSPFLSPLHNDERWQVWISTIEQVNQDRVDRQVIENLRSYLERHPELYVIVQENPEES